MDNLIREMSSEIADNWPAFLFIANSAGFSILFLRERRAETRMLREAAETLQQGLHSRLDRLECAIDALSKRDGNVLKEGPITQLRGSRRAETCNQ